jgi:hypothetical protein
MAERYYLSYVVKKYIGSHYCTYSEAKIHSVETSYGINSVILKLITFAKNAETGQF